MTSEKLGQYFHELDLEYQVIFFFDVKDVNYTFINSILTAPYLEGQNVNWDPGLRIQYPRNWRKIKGIATVRLRDRTLRRAEVHWFEAHGIGKKEMRIKRFLD